MRPLIDYIDICLEIHLILFIYAENYLIYSLKASEETPTASDELDEKLESTIDNNAAADDNSNENQPKASSNDVRLK